MYNMKKILLVLLSAIVAPATLQANANLAGASFLPYPFDKAALSGSLPYEYVTSEWLEEKNYDLDAVSQEIAGAPGSTVSDSATIISGGAHSATFSFEFADSIKSNGTINGLDTDVRFANEGREIIELFYIKNGGKYLTVLDTTVFIYNPPDSTVTNTQLGWKPKTTGTDKGDSLRQAFAIIRDTEKEIITFLPVASCKWKLKDGQPSYGRVPHYNLKIGSVTDNSGNAPFSCDLSSTWYITQSAQTGANQPQRLIIVDPAANPAPSHNAIWFKTTLTLDLWNGPDYGCDKDSVVGIYQKTDGQLYYYSAKGKVHISDDYREKMTGNIRGHWHVKQVQGSDRGRLQRWVFTPEIETVYGIPQQLVLRDSFIVLNLGGDTVELISTAEKPSKRDIVRIECVNNEFSPFMNIDHLVKSSKEVILLETKEGRNFAYNDALTDNPLGAFLKPVEKGDKTAYSRLTVYKSNTQYLGKPETHEVPYYIFSYTGTNDKEYFLKANASVVSGNSVQWESLSAKDKEELLKSETWNFAPYKFCLPLVSGGTEEGAVYLQTLDSTQREDYALIKVVSGAPGVQAVRFKKALKYSSKEYYDSSEGIYSAIDQYQNNIVSDIAGWRIISEDETGFGWRRVNAAVDAGNRQAAGVFTHVNYPIIAAGYTFIAPSTTGGVLATINQACEFTLEYRGAAEIGYKRDSVWYYGIYYTTDTSDSLYLTDAGTDNVSDVVFTDRIDYCKSYSNSSVYADSLFRQTFALKYVEPDDRREHSHFEIVSSADYTKKQNIYRYLTGERSRLIFVNNSNLAYNFQWGRIEDGKYTGLKKAGTPAKIYGVAGGVKAVNAGGAVSVYTVDGRLVTARPGVSANQTIAVPAGIYIVKNGANVVKVVVK